MNLRRKLIDTGACTFLEWPTFLGEIPPTVEAQYAALDVWITGKKKKEQAERSASLRAYVKEACGRTTFPNQVTSESSWRTGDLRNIIDHCPLGKARGVDRWSIGELRLLPDIAINDLATLLKHVEIIGVWPKDIREMMYLQLPKERARDAGERRPIAPLLQVYRLRRALCRHDVKQWRARCTSRGEVLVERGALDETFEFALETELTTAAGEPQAGIFLDCSKCYERIPLRSLETFALESGYPTYALYAAVDMYSGRRRILIQGAVSEAVQTTHGMPLGCGHAVDLLHAFLLKTLQSAGSKVEVWKIDDGNMWMTWCWSLSSLCIFVMRTDECTAV
eukprot:6490968-Amphidinium_carterae.4